jgi:hypothetical protein
MSSVMTEDEDDIPDPSSIAPKLALIPKNQARSLSIAAQGDLHRFSVVFFGGPNLILWTFSAWLD